VILAEHHPRVGVERRPRVARDHALEELLRLLGAAVLAGGEADQVQHQVEAAEARVLGRDRPVQALRLAQIELGLARGPVAAGAAAAAALHRALVTIHARDVDPARVLPQQLGQLEQALGAAVAGRRAGEEAAQEADRLGAAGDGLALLERQPIGQHLR
jgi:hypothetical protein